MSIDPDPHPDFATAGELADAILAPGDLGDLPDLQPTAPGALALADVDKAMNTYHSTTPSGTLPAQLPAEYDAWRVTDRALVDAHDAAHDAADAVQGAEAKDRAAAVEAARHGRQPARPTAQAARDTAAAALRGYDAALVIANEALARVRPALRRTWPTWRTELIDNINRHADRGRQLLVELEAALINKAAAVNGLLAVDRMFGEAKPGQVIEHLPPPDAIPGTWQQPASNGVNVAVLLRDGPSLSANRAARQLPDLRDVRTMLNATTMNEEWQRDDGLDDDSPPAA